MVINADEANKSGVHPIELCVYSLLSNNLESIYQSINELRESQAMLILRLKQIKAGSREEHELITAKCTLQEEIKRLKGLEKRTMELSKRYERILSAL